MRMDRTRIAEIRKWVFQRGAKGSYVADTQWLVQLAEAQAEALMKWEMIAERDHGKPPGRFDDVVEEIDGRVKAAELHVRDLHEMLMECITYVPDDCGLMDDILDELDMERVPMTPRKYRSKGEKSSGGDLG